jgi:dihydropteroate synthase
MLLDGATAGIDIGGMSSRPGAGIISSNDRVGRAYCLGHEKCSIKEFPKRCYFRVDTIHAETAKVCLDEGAKIINDISGGEYDSNMFSTVVEL